MPSSYSETRVVVTRYRKKPVVIEATQWDGLVEDATRVIDWVLGSGGTARYHDEDPAHIAIDTLEGTMRTPPKWFVIKGVKGEFYSCDPEVFEATYEKVEEPEEPRI
jgi:hypothetical protein